MRLNTLYEGLKHYITDTTGLLLSSTPIYATMETLGAGMSSATSLEAKLKVAGLAYCGFGILYAKGRDLSRKVFKVTPEKSEFAKSVHDSIYNIAWNIPLATAIYLTSGADLEQTAKGVAGSAVLGLFSGPANGYSIDIFRDFVGTKKTDRKMPKVFSSAGRKIKKLFALGMIAAMLAYTATIYAINDKYLPNSETRGEQIESIETSLENALAD